mmetsp:Transcript_11434/g.27680  ORF Transcript_11434/g.27680 Transcript_11434/m.27680 type:complete len:237 (-) Transcript_11434:59-769(-)
MSMRLRRQSKKVSQFGLVNGVPGPGSYAFRDERTIGNTKSNFQEWRTKPRKTDWYVPKGRVPTEFDLNLDGHSIGRRLETTPERLKTTMGSRVPRCPVSADSRRPREKLNYATFMVTELATTPDELGPGAYKLESEKDMGRTRSQFQTWKSPKRATDWWLRRSDAPSNLFDADLSMHPSRKSCGGRDSQLWPLPEDEWGVPVCDNPYDYLLTQSRGPSRAGGSRASLPRRPMSSAF